MWLNSIKTSVLDDSDVDSSGEEIPIWVKGEQRWVSGICDDTTCHDVLKVLLHDEDVRVSYFISNFKREHALCVLFPYNYRRVNSLSSNRDNNFTGSPQLIIIYDGLLSYKSISSSLFERHNLL